jgi:hypothetical protein
MLEEEFGSVLDSVEEYVLYREFVGYSPEYDHYIDMFDLHANDQRHYKVINFI